MRSMALLLTGFALVALASTGCDALKRVGSWTRSPANTAPLEARDAQQFVSYLNQQAAALRSIRYDDVSVSARGPDGPMPRLTEGTLACAKPRYFRMMSGHLLTSGSEVDLGSNDQEFWIFMKRPSPTMLYSSHEDFASGRSTLPIPFETDWVLQALGMKEYDLGLNYSVDIDQKDRVYTLSYDNRTPQGQDVRTVIVFSGDRETAGRPQIRKYVVLNPNRQVIASAEIREVREVSAELPGNSAIVPVQVPTRVVLEWPQEKYKMDLTLGKQRVNAPMSQQEFDFFFRRPEIRGATAINLADARFRPSSYRGSTPTTFRPRLFGSR